MTRKHSAQSPVYAVSDEAAAFIADALMELALQFEATHFAQIRRHDRSITPKRSTAPRQLDLFGKHPAANAASECFENLISRLSFPPAPRTFLRIAAPQTQALALCLLVSGFLWFDRAAGFLPPRP